MKFLAALVHATAATQLWFTTFVNQPLDVETRNPYRAYSGEVWKIRFRTPSIAEYGNVPGTGDSSTLTIENFKFSVKMPKHIPKNASMWLLPYLSPSIFGWPTGPPVATTRIPISDSVDGVHFQWTPEPPIIVTPNTTYWFQLDSTSETLEDAPMWLHGDIGFSSENDPMENMKLGVEQDRRFTTISRHKIRFAPSLQVYAKHTFCAEVPLRGAP
ncbi:hypothetical protein H257_11881 [Aphanomyces astaci]|uniref:Uncharacterized protein n=1 Tax=Aphanomyces astaci TaxID=112090 RepID=W4G0Z4_APHAT|nr:hypothetical protein H257_11881 [Aphanomyces astaci]ETV73382.1 hypothetical protein H257_11881 [Aphanomyces astaci]|eukprot:XP_009837257.1 hypothetical protein H257_11881 [Aphanomyces astaci]